MEHVGRIWFGNDDPSTATRAKVELSSDGGIVIRVGDSLAAEWDPVDVDIIGEHPVAEFRVEGELVNFEPDDPEAWTDDIAAARMRVRLQGIGTDGGIQPGVGETVGEMGTAIATTGPTGAAPAGGHYCPACGEPIDPRAEICPRCGVRQYSLVIRPYKSRAAAGLLALFLGGFGAHHFYLGHVGRGILYLLFFWTFIPAFISFFEALVFFFSSDASFDAKYNS